METPFWLTLTTLPHFIAAWIAHTHGNPLYAVIISASTLASVAWYATGSEKGTAKEWTDLILALAWGVADTCLCPRSIIPNLIVAGLRPVMAQGHWHLISALKAAAVAAAV
jgi:hypothetical protein